MVFERRLGPIYFVAGRIRALHIKNCVPYIPVECPLPSFWASSSCGSAGSRPFIAAQSDAKGCLSFRLWLGSVIYWNDVSGALYGRGVRLSALLGWLGSPFRISMGL